MGGYWGQNIGNAFFNLGGKHLLDEAVGSQNVALIGDNPGYRTFNDQSKGMPKNALDLLARLDVEFLVLQGPMLTMETSALWQPTLNTLRQQGTKLVLLGVGLFKYTDQEVAAAQAFVKDNAAIIAGISTRDSRTYAALAGLVPAVNDGVDSAFAVPDAYRPPAVRDPRPVILTFDRRPEPRVVEAAQASDTTESVTWDDRTILMDFARVPSRLAAKDKVLAYAGQMLNRHPGAEELFGHPVWRTEHRTNPFIRPKVYQRPNTLATDEPWSYATVYAHSALTITDRVHASVLTLAYGNPTVAMMPSPRAELLTRVGIDRKSNRAQTLSEDHRRSEVASVVDFLRQILT